MTRSTPEWVGKTANTAIPPRVRLRVFERQDGKCAECGVKLGGKMRPEYDHTLAIVNGGENRESNLQALCGPCHKQKTSADVAIKKKNRRVRSKHIGIHQPKSKFPTSRDGPYKAKVSGGYIRRGEE